MVMKKKINIIKKVKSIINQKQLSRYKG